MALSQKERQQLLGILIVVAVAGVVLFWMYWRAPRVTEMANLQIEIDSVTLQVNSAKRALARGDVQALEQEVATYAANLTQMRQWVPTQNELPDLLDAIALAARQRGVVMGTFNPQAGTPDGPFTLFRIPLQVTGYYDQIAEFLSDVASLPRIMVPTGLSLSPASGADITQFGDTTGSLLSASFEVRTYVKESAGGTGDGQ